MCILIAITKNFSVFVHSPDTYGNFDYKNFVTGYLGIPLYLIMIAGYKIVKRKPGIKAWEADLFGGKDAIDREEEEFLAEKARKDEMRGKGMGKTGGWFYRTFLSWLF